MDAAQFSFSKPAEALEQLKQFAYGREIFDVNRWLYYILLSENNMWISTEASSVETALRWAEVVNFCYRQLLEDQLINDATILYKYLMFRINLTVSLGQIANEELTDPTIITDMLQERLKQYESEKVRKVLQIWKSNPSALELGELHPLRQLKYWILILERLHKIDGYKPPNSLDVWKQYKGDLP